MTSKIEKIVFVSNCLNHHQVPLCDALIKRCNSFYFIATNVIKDCGYQSAIEKDYVVHYFGEEEKAHKAILESDIVLFGSCQSELIELRVNTGKLTFIYSERFFKERWRRFNPKTRQSIFNRVLKFKNNPNVYVLCASAYLPNDLTSLCFPLNKCFKWGYFPEVKKYANLEEVIKQKRPGSILWVARFIKLKHPEVPIKIANKLKEEGYQFKLNMIGNGVERQRIEKLIKKYKLTDCVHLLGSMSPEEVRKEMEQSGILLFTSDRNEGWGAVLNESMNSACAVVANKAIGSVPYLIKDGDNGFIYNGKFKDLYKKIKYLIDNSQARKAISMEAYRTMVKVWNADVAVSRLLVISEKIENDEKTPFDDGPCSNV